MTIETIEMKMTFHLLVPGAMAAPVGAQLRFAVTDPYAISVVFHTGQGKVEWIFARDLLADGLLTPSGEGDILVRPAAEDPARVLLELNAPTGFAILSAPADLVAEFLDRTYNLVPIGAESAWVDFERELAKLASTS